MIPGRFPLNIYRGDTFRWKFTLWTDSTKTAPAVLVGVSPLGEIRDRPGGTFIAALTCTITLPNIIDAVLAAADSARLPTSAAWDLQLTYPDASVSTVLSGPVNVTPDVSSPMTTVTALARAR
jgi:hypothetical protein